MAFWLHNECLLILKKSKNMQERHKQYQIVYCPEITTTNRQNLSKNTYAWRHGFDNAVDVLYHLLKTGWIRCCGASQISLSRSQNFSPSCQKCRLIMSYSWEHPQGLLSLRELFCSRLYPSPSKGFRHSFINCLMWVWDFWFPCLCLKCIWRVF